MRFRGVRYRFNFFNPQNAKIFSPSMKFERWVVIRGKVFGQFRLPADNGIKYAVYVNSTGVSGMNGETNNSSTELIKYGYDSVGFSAIDSHLMKSTDQNHRSHCR